MEPCGADIIRDRLSSRYELLATRGALVPSRHGSSQSGGTKRQHHGARSPPSTIIPASCRNPASRHSRCSAQARASGLAGGQRPKTALADHAQHAPQPRSIAWEGGGEAAMKGGALEYYHELAGTLANARDLKVIDRVRSMSPCPLDPPPDVPLSFVSCARTAPSR